VIRTPLRSSTLAGAGWRRGVLELEFRSGSLYRYHGVPEGVFEALLAAPSRGRFFSRRIRGRYPAERLY
jgi:KTSC domain